MTHPVLVMAGRYDRTCAVGASEDMAARLPDPELVVFEKSAHMMFAEEQDRYVATIREFLDRVAARPRVERSAAEVHRPCSSCQNVMR